MKRFFGTVLAVFVSLVLFFVAVPVLLLPTLVTGKQKPDLPGQMVLELDLRQDFSDQPHHNPLNVLGAGTPSIVRVVEALAQAETDERVSGIVVRLDGGKGLPLAQAEEIRESFTSFRGAGKFVVVHSQSFYAAGIGSYFAASESDELWMQPNGSLATSTVSLGTVFLKGMLENAGVRVKTEDELKQSTATTLINTNLGGGFRTAYDDTAEVIYSGAIASIAKSKKMTPDQIRSLFASGPYLASEALAAGLVSHLGYDDEARKSALRKAGDGAEMVAWDTYLDGAGSPFDEGEVIAVIYGEGTINIGDTNPVESGSIGSDTTAKAIRDAANDKMVKAILFRIDSPGGSAVASDQIWDAVNYAKDKGKPVVVSMGRVAAAGGYYVAMSADKIIAQPATITGSIGVVGGKFAIGSNYSMLGLTVNDAVNEVGGNKTETGSQSDEQWQAVNKVLGNIYTDFTSKVAEGRGMSVEDVHRIAQGRIWSGAQAKQIGLVDELGGFRFAIGETKKMIGLDESAAVELRAFPGPKGKRQQFMDLLGVSANIMKMFYAVSQLGQVETLKDLAETIYNEDHADVGQAAPKDD